MGKRLASINTFNAAVNKDVAAGSTTNAAALYRWQQSFLWESPLANGVMPAYQTIDAQVTYRLPSIKSSVKLGGTNIFNQRYIQYAAGPTIGGLYYASVTVDGLLNR